MVLSIKRLGLALALVFLMGGQVWAQVAFDACSESHTSTTPSLSEASFNWTHTPSGTPRGVLVYVFVLTASTDHTTSAPAVTHAGTTVTPIATGIATDTAGEPLRVEAYYLGTGVTSGAQTVVVNRTNNGNSMYAVACTVTATTDTEVYEAGIVLEQEDQTITEENVTDNSPGTNSVRFIGLASGQGAIVSAGANTTAALDIDIGGQTAQVGRETTAGQGSRPVGFVNAVSEDTAAIYLAVREVVAAPTGSGIPNGMLLLGTGSPN